MAKRTLTLNSFTSRNLYFLSVDGSCWDRCEKAEDLISLTLSKSLSSSINGQHSGSRQITWPIGWLAGWSNAWNGASSTGCGTRRRTSWSITSVTTQLQFACPQPTLRGALGSFLANSSLLSDTEHRGFPGIRTGLFFVILEWLLCLRLLHLYFALN